jgi:hypothetical protein
MMVKVNIITTGGTIEEVYSEQTGSEQNLKNEIDRYLGRLRLTDCEIVVVPLMNKDSLEMTDADREVVLEKVMELIEDKARCEFNGSSFIVPSDTPNRTTPNKLLSPKVEGINLIAPR